MAKVLVTGGSGFIGSHIVDELLEKRHEVVSLDIIGSDFSTYRFCDIQHFDSVQRCFSSFLPDYVIHCAAKARIQPSLADPVATYRTNVMGTVNILEACRQFKVRKIVYSGSSSVYGGYGPDDLSLNETLKPFPLNTYAYTKWMAELAIEQYVKNYGIKAVILRYFNVYGPRQPSEGQYATVIGIFLRQMKNNEPFTIVPDGNQKRDFTYVSDVVRANILAMELDLICGGEIINIGSGKNYSILEVADIIGGPDYPRVFIAPRMGEARETLADIKRAEAFLVWKPEVSLEQGIKILKEQI